MIRTQVYIPDDLYRELRLLAQTSGKNISELLRESATEVIKKNQIRKDKKKKWGQGFIGAGKGGPKNLAKNIDRYLYGQ